MNTEPVSPDVAAKARKYQALALQRISAVGQNEIARQIGISDTTVSRYVSADLERACQVLAAAGLKVVPTEMRCYNPEYIGAIFTLAKIKMQTSENPEHLTFED